MTASLVPSGETRRLARTADFSCVTQPAGVGPRTSSVPEAGTGMGSSASDASTVSVARSTWSSPISQAAGHPYRVDDPQAPAVRGDRGLDRDRIPEDARHGVQLVDRDPRDLLAAVRVAADRDPGDELVLRPRDLEADAQPVAVGVDEEAGAGRGVRIAGHRASGRIEPAEASGIDREQAGRRGRAEDGHVRQCRRGRPARDWRDRQLGERRQQRPDGRERDPGQDDRRSRSHRRVVSGRRRPR